MRTVMTFVVLLAIITALVIAGPLLTIWALNTLFPVLAIEYTVWTWLAALVIGALFSPVVKVKK